MIMILLPLFYTSMLFSPVLAPVRAPRPVSTSAFDPHRRRHP